MDTPPTKFAIMRANRDEQQARADKKAEISAAENYAARRIESQQRVDAMMRDAEAGLEKVLFGSHEGKR